MRIRPRLDHEYVGAKVPEGGGNHQLENLQVARALGERLQRQIELQATAGSRAELANLPGPREEVLARLVKAHGQNARVFVEDLLDAVGVVDVDVEIGHLQAVPGEGVDRDREIVVDAETRREAGPRVMQPPSELKNAASLSLPRSGARRAACPRRATAPPRPCRETRGCPVCRARIPVRRKPAAPALSFSTRRTYASWCTSRRSSRVAGSGSTVSTRCPSAAEKIEQSCRCGRG